MANRRGKKKANPPLIPASARAALVRFSWRALGLTLIGLAVAFALALLTFNGGDPTLNRATDAAAANLLGWPGAYLADLLLQTVGLGAVAIILAFLGWGWRLGTLGGMPRVWLNLMAFPFFVVVVSAAAASIEAATNWPASAGYGGIMGSFITSVADRAVFALVGVYPPHLVVFAALAVLAIALGWAALGLDRAEWRFVTGKSVGFVRKSLHLMRELAELAFRRPSGAEAGPAKRTKKPRAKKKSKEKTGPAKKRTSKAKVAPRSKPKEGKRATRERQGAFDLGGGKPFQLPTLDLLSEPGKTGGSARINKESLEQNARLLESVLDDFGIQGEIVNVRPGPVVTLYELEPAPGTKSSRVISLSDDIARSMSAASARVAVVPGRNAIGIELPNPERETVLLREVLSSSAFEKATGKLPLVLGKDIGGAPVIVDLAAMPHLLVAGTTGSGQSVGLNAMILSLMYRFTPQECRFILVDPKMLELSIYDGIPHLLTPVVTEAKKAVVALKWAVREMEERYRAMSKLGVRNLTAYNKQVSGAKAKGKPLARNIQTGFDKKTGEPIVERLEFDFEPLPLVVIVIDEMADLMLVAGKDVEATVQRLAQMARAAGIHLIMATQRPSVDVITGTIKANFPTRIAFQVTSKIDSRTILGDQGAEQLLGQGDMLYLAGAGRVTRVHGPFVSDQEVEKVVAQVKLNGAPDYLTDVTEEPEEGYDSPFIPGGSGQNALYDQAVEVVLRDRKASTSYVQRRLKIGYNRAATLIEEMEENGVISGPNHAGRREILVPEAEE
ncbi:MAG: DNA translocase FtsK 4TM domain-containing protein [Sphingomonadales bacterium]